MNTKKRLTGLKILLSGIVSFLFPSLGLADFGDVISKFHPYMDFQETYTDNLDLTNSHRIEDWITRIAPGIRFSTLPARATVPGQIREAPIEPSGAELDYQAGFVSYAKNSEDNYISHDARVRAWYTFDQRLTVNVRDYFTKSNETRERSLEGGVPSATRYLSGVRRDRSVYYRNVFEPSVGYQFTHDSRLDVGYRNNIYESRSPLYEDSQENFINPVLTHWFNIRNGIILDYGFTNGEFERSPDFNAHRARGRYIYRFNPRTSIFGEYVYENRNFDEPGIDYEVHNPSVGLEHAFTATLSGHIQGGYFWQNPKGRSSVTGATYEAGLTKAGERTTYSFLFQGGYTQDFFTAENLGFTRYHRVVGTITQRLGERMTGGISATLERDEFPLLDRRDWVWVAGGNFSYEPFRWLVLSLDYYHQENTSNLPDYQYMENRVMLTVHAIM